MANQYSPDVRARAVPMLFNQHSYENTRKSRVASRVGRTAVDEERDNNGPDGGEWQFGYNRRSVGSLHIDALTISASDLAQRGVMAVYPVGGWWKESRNVDAERCRTRFSLVAEIDAEEEEVDLYAEVQQAIAAQIPIQV